MNLKAGPIVGSPTTGLCTRVVVEVKQIYDACVTKLSNENLSLTLTDFSGGTTPPYTFVSAEARGTSVISNQIVTPIEGRRHRVSIDVTVPILVTYLDSQGVSGTARASYVMHRDVILNIPEPTLATYRVEAATALISRIGTFTSNTTVNFTCCIVQVIKIPILVDILIPTYGYANYPSCTDYGDELCQGLFNLPLFPTNT